MQPLLEECRLLGNEVKTNRVLYNKLLSHVTEQLSLRVTATGARDVPARSSQETKRDTTYSHVNLVPTCCGPRTSRRTSRAPLLANSWLLVAVEMHPYP
jgi:hypothetical protein